MYDRTPRPAPRRRSVALPLGIASTICLVILGAVAGTLLVQRSTHGATVTSSATATTTVRARPLFDVPTNPPLSSVPPPAHPFSLQQNAIEAAATPCPTQSLPPAVLQFGATPSPGATVTPAPTKSAISPCGTGQPLGPHCYSTLPGTPPTLDEVRQKLYDVAAQDNLAFPLVEAIAWQESGWQENVKACDGGVGVMQLMPDTTNWLNTTYKTNYTPYDLDGNIHLGVRLLQFLYDYYLPFCNQGLANGTTCTGDTVWPQATDDATLRNIIESAYNEGAGTMATYGIINWWYVHPVENLRQQFILSQQ